MRRYRSLIVLGVTAAILGVALWLGQRPTGHATLEACLDAHAEAARAGDVAGYLACLSAPLRSRTLESYPDTDKLREAIRQNNRTLKSVVQVGEPEITGAQAKVFLDEVRPAGTRRICYHLERGNNGWLISGIEAPQDVPTVIPFGTHVKDVP
ncbi:MAG: hypothetical protein AB7K24_10170 [Gemmataceae bacterium]